MARTHGRDDLAGGLGALRDQLVRPDTVVLVVGEFKQGKSALVNAILAQEVCPVADDVATAAVTIVRHGREPRAVVSRREEGQRLTEEVSISALTAVATDDSATSPRRLVELVDVELPNEFLARGISLVDTPGIGGLNEAHAAATLAFLPAADALVFVTDASSEISSAELDFLERARRGCPVVLVVVTKIDLHPAWRRIVEIDRRYLSAIGFDESPRAVSAALRLEAVRRGDERLGELSSVPALADEIATRVVNEAAASARQRALTELANAIAQLRAPLASEKRSLEDPQTAQQLRAELLDVRRRLRELSNTSANWAVVLRDGFDAALVEVQHEFAARLRRLQRDRVEELEAIDPAADWEDYSARLQQSVADAAASAHLRLADSAEEVRRRVNQELRDDEQLGKVSLADSLVTQSWSAQFGRDLTAKKGMSMDSIGFVESAKLGVEIVGVLGAILSTAIVGPAMLGAALLFGGRYLRQERQRQLVERRQEARTFVIDFIEDVRFEIDGRLRGMASQLSHQAQQDFSGRLAQLTTTFEQAAEALESAIARSTTERETRLGQLGDQLRLLDELIARASGPISVDQQQDRT